MDCTEEISRLSFLRSGMCLRHRRNANMRALRASGAVEVPHVENPMPRSERGKLHAGRSLGRTGPLTYVGAHQRIKARYGAATAYECRSCGQGANEWAYQGGDPGEQWGWRRPTVQDYWVVWSSNPEYYSPMCYKCHRALDSQSEMKTSLLTHMLRSLPESQLRTVLNSYNEVSSQPATTKDV